MTEPITDKVQIICILNLCHEGRVRDLIKKDPPDLWPSESEE